MKRQMNGEACQTACYAEAFGPFDGRVWMNAADQGPLPLASAAAAQQAVSEKLSPHRMGVESFQAVPQRLRRALGRLIGAPESEIILGNSTSYGLDLLANCIRWNAGDEVLLTEGDFPADTSPWLPLQKLGVRIRFATAGNGAISAGELAPQIASSTRLFCTTWVNSFTGFAADIAAIGEICRASGVSFVLNASQAIGARVLDVQKVAVDAVVSCGSKWLCGPYGTGFCWMTPNLLDSLEIRHAYWLAMQTGHQLESEQRAKTEVNPALGAHLFDVFGTANFFNFLPWTTSIEYLLEQSITEIARYDNELVSYLINCLNPNRSELLSPPDGPSRSSLVVIRPKAGHSRDLHQFLSQAGIDTALRRGNIRFSPHLYNSHADIDRLLSALAAFP